MLSTLSLKWSGDEGEARLEKWDQQTNQQTNCTKATPKKRNPDYFHSHMSHVHACGFGTNPKDICSLNQESHHFVGHQTNSSHGPNNNTRNPKRIRKGTQLDQM